MTTPALLADVFSGVRIGEERRNVLTGGRQVTGAMGVSCEPHFLVKSIFVLFFLLLPLLFGLLRPFFAVLWSSPAFRCPAFPRMLVRLLPPSRTACGTFLCAASLPSRQRSAFLRLAGDSAPCALGRLGGSGPSGASFFAELQVPDLIRPDCGQQILSRGHCGTLSVLFWGGTHANPRRRLETSL